MQQQRRKSTQGMGQINTGEHCLCPAWNQKSTLSYFNLHDERFLTKTTVNKQHVALGTAIHVILGVTGNQFITHLGMRMFSNLLVKLITRVRAFLKMLNYLC